MGKLSLRAAIATSFVLFGASVSSADEVADARLDIAEVNRETSGFVEVRERPADEEAARASAAVKSRLQHASDTIAKLPRGADRAALARERNIAVIRATFAVRYDRERAPLKHRLLPFGDASLDLSDLSPTRRARVLAALEAVDDADSWEPKAGKSDEALRVEVTRLFDAAARALDPLIGDAEVEPYFLALRDANDAAVRRFRSKAIRNGRCVTSGMMPVAAGQRTCSLREVGVLFTNEEIDRRRQARPSTEGIAGGIGR